jgi:hypothetical protein
MKELMLVCQLCDSRKTFRGKDAHEIILAIDATELAGPGPGWRDLPSDADPTLGPGQMPAICPDCMES